jgi:chromate reductase, NAD(P)H dehydrogenase (quinone)
MKTEPTKILAISGSLRPNSSNSKIIQYIAGMVPENTEYTIYNELSSIPAFDDAEAIPATVIAWRRLLQNADAVLICTPEYAFGIPGALKNAIDWTVSSGELVNKPLALITAATGGDKAHAAFLQIFTALSANIPVNGALLIPFIKTKLDVNGNIVDEKLRHGIQQLLNGLIAAVPQE